MVARDDSVIRGSLIASLIFLVLSFALNFFLWSWGDGQAIIARDLKEDVNDRDNDIRELGNSNSLMKSMLGFGTTTQAEFDQMASTTGSDPEIDQILTQYTGDMTAFGAEVEPQNRNYHALPEYLVNAIRVRNQQFSQSQVDLQTVRVDTAKTIEIAENAKEDAVTAKAKAEKNLADETAKNTEQRAAMTLTMESAKDMQNKTMNDFNKFRGEASANITKLSTSNTKLGDTIESQRVELTRLRSDQFESTQGKIVSRERGGDIVLVNLGSSEALHPGVTFGVIDGTETRLKDADVKASIQITRILGMHLAEARVVARPKIGAPIIPGDKIFSPFWAPGRRVRIALAGNIDIDQDGRPDTEALQGMITAAGAEVAAVVDSSNPKAAKLDSGIRFLVVGETPEDADLDDPNVAREVKAVGEMKQRARELGLTVIPAWKLQDYLRAINDTLTTPLGSAVRGDDFPPVPNIEASRQLPNDLPGMYQNQLKGQQEGNKVLQP